MRGLLLLLLCDEFSEVSMRSAQLTAFNKDSIGDMPMNCIFLLEPKICSDMIRGLSIVRVGVMKEIRKERGKAKGERNKISCYIYWCVSGHR